MSLTNVFVSSLDCCLAFFCTQKIRVLAILIGALSFVSTAYAADPLIYTERRGLRADDEFDAAIRRAFGCPGETYKKMIADINERNGKAIPIPTCPVEGALKQIIERNSGGPSSAVDYIRSKGGKCSDLGADWHCVVTRKVTSVGHAGDYTGGTLTDLFTIEISIAKGQEPIAVKLTREGIGR